MGPNGRYKRTDHKKGHISARAHLIREGEEFQQKILLFFFYTVLVSLPSRADNWLVDTESEPEEHGGLSEFGKVRQG